MPSQHVSQWKRLRPSEIQITLLLAAAIGFMGALSTVLFRECMDALHWLLSGHREGLVQTAEALLWWRLLLPAAGGLCAGLILQFGIRLARGRSTSD